MDVSNLPTGYRPQVTQPYPFLANDVWAGHRPRSRRWPWMLLALLAGVALAIFVTDWEEPSYSRNKTAQREPRQLPVTLPTAPINRNDKSDKPQPTAPMKETGDILQVDRQGPVPGATSDPAKQLIGLPVEQEQPKPSSPDLTLQTAMVRMPALSILRVYFPKPFVKPPEINLSNDTVMPTEVSIDEVTNQYVVIRNAHATNDCYFRYRAEGKLKPADTPK